MNPARAAVALERRPVRSAFALALAWLAVSIAVFLLVSRLEPGIDPQAAALVALVVITVLVLGGIGWLGWWHEVGFTPISEWRNLRLLVLPAVITVVPLLAGVDPIAASTLLFLVVGYTLTGLAEEAFARGLLIRILQPSGVLRAVFISSLLFALLHLGNLVIRGGSPAVSIAQAVGAFSFGVGFAALRIRTWTIWPLVALHMVHDLVLNTMSLPLIPVAVAQDVALLVIGLYLIREPLLHRQSPGAIPGSSRIEGYLPTSSGDRWTPRFCHERALFRPSTSLIAPWPRVARGSRGSGCRRVKGGLHGDQRERTRDQRRRSPSPGAAIGRLDGHVDDR